MITFELMCFFCLGKKKKKKKLDGSPIEINYMVVLINAAKTMLSFRRIIKFNFVVYWSMQSHD